MDKKRMTFVNFFRLKYCYLSDGTNKEIVDSLPEGIHPSALIDKVVEKILLMTDLEEIFVSVPESSSSERIQITIDDYQDKGKGIKEKIVEVSSKIIWERLKKDYPNAAYGDYRIRQSMKYFDIDYSKVNDSELKVIIRDLWDSRQIIDFVEIDGRNYEEIAKRAFIRLIFKKYDEVVLGGIRSYLKGKVKNSWIVMSKFRAVRNLW